MPAEIEAAGPYLRREQRWTATIERGAPGAAR
jgi:hypothetical protein